MGVKLLDLMPDMPMLYSFRTYLLSRAIVDCHKVLSVFLQKRQFLAAILLSNDVESFRSSRETFTDCVRTFLIFPRVDRSIRECRRHMTSGEKCDVTLKCIVLCGVAAARPNFGRHAVVTSCHSTIARESKYVRKLWHVRHEIWELNSHGSGFSVPNPRGPLKSLFGFVLQKRWLRV